MVECTLVRIQEEKRATMYALSETGKKLYAMISALSEISTDLKITAERVSIAELKADRKAPVLTRKEKDFLIDAVSDHISEHYFADTEQKKAERRADRIFQKLGIVRVEKKK